MTKIYFASDFHLGAPSWESAKKREELIIRWLSEVVDQPWESTEVTHKSFQFLKIVQIGY